MMGRAQAIKRNERDEGESQSRRKKDHDSGLEDPKMNKIDYKASP